MKKQTLPIVFALAATTFALTTTAAHADPDDSSSSSSSAQQGSDEANKAFHQAAGMDPVNATDSVTSAIDKGASNDPAPGE